MTFRYKPPVASVVAAIGSRFGRRKDEDVDNGTDSGASLTDGEVVYSDDIISFVMDELEKRKAARLPLEQQWTLNANYLCGNQLCDIAPYLGGGITQVEQALDHIECETFNRIAPLIETRIANLKKIKYAMTVKPRTNELDDYAKAEVSTAVLRFVQDNSNFNQKRDTMIAWNELCGSCFILSWWTEGEDSDIDYGLITPYEVYPESIFKQGIDAQRSIILEQVKTVEEIQELYGITVEGGEVQTFALTPVGSGAGFGHENTCMAVSHRTQSDSVKLVTYLERPSKTVPNGRMIIIAGVDKIVYCGNLPYSRIPLVQVVCKDVPGQFFGMSVIQELIPLQRAYNNCVNRIHEYIKRSAIPSYFVEAGAIDVDAFVEEGTAAGAVTPYAKGHNPPQPFMISALPSEAMAERQNLVRDMEYIAGVSQLMVTGNTPSGVTSGTAISNLMEIDNTRLSLTGDRIRSAVRDLGQLWLEIYKRYAHIRRVISMTGTNSIGNTLTWSSEDINSYDVQFETENELRFSDEAQREKFMQAFSMGLFADERGVTPQRFKKMALSCLKLDQYGEIMSIHDLQIQNAQREQAMLERGVLPEVSEFDDHEVHFDEHLRYVLQMRFRVLKGKKPEFAALFETHLKEHARLASGFGS